jgi:hypothetical protein
MRLTSIVTIADGAYPEGWIFPNWNPGCEEPTPQPVGDSLAWFIANELHGVYDAARSDKEQLAAAANAIDKAMRELRNVRDALTSAYVDASLEAWAKKERGAA